MAKLKQLDFTLDIYKKLLASLIKANYEFITFSQYLDLKDYNNLPSRFVILRHDVDDLPQNSSNFADVQAKLNIHGTYYFRVVPKSFDKKIIRKIAGQGHEIGYHYETMDTSLGDVDAAYEDFSNNLKKFQTIADIETISMHGSPMSRFNNLDIWRKYSYKSLGIKGEPYFDFDFNEIFYLTDTGRAWDGHQYNVRDKAPKENPLTNSVFQGLNFHSTHEIILALREGSFPKQVMINFHPERWSNNIISWVKQFVWQNLKNQIKRIILLTRKPS